MVRTTPTYIHGDNLSIKEYFNHLFAEERFQYSSRWKWWKQTTLYGSIPLAIASVLLLAALLYQELNLREEPDWTLVFSLSLLPFICCLPFIWMGSYYYSFTAAKKITKDLDSFIAQYIPNADHVTTTTLTSRTLQRKDLEFEVGYSIVAELDANEKVKQKHPCFFIGLYYSPKPGTELKWFDEKAHMRDSFIENMKAYLDGKESRRHLLLEDYAIFALFKQKELNNTCKVTNEMEQMQYLLTRFDFLPKLLSTSQPEEG